MKKKFFRLSAAVLLFSRELWRLAGAFFTWWPAVKEGEGKRKEMV